MPRHVSRLTTCAAATAALSATVLAAPALASTHSGFSGRAYGSTAKSGTTAHSNKTALVPLCTTKTGVTHSDKSAAVPVPGFGTVGAVTTHVASRHPKAGTVESISKTHTGATHLLAGAIHATAVDTSADVMRSPSGYSHAASTTLVGVTVAGHSMPVHPTRNQTFAIPGVGRVVMNHTKYSKSHGVRKATVTALTLTAKANNTAGVPAGQLVIGHAAASLHKPVHRVAFGNAYGSAIRGSGPTSGRSAPVYLPCAGSDGSVQRNSTAAAKKAGALNLGDVASTGTSTDSAKATRARTHSRISNFNLFGGLITGKNITAKARAVRTDGQLTRSSAGTIGHLVIRGKKVSVAKPVKRTLSGIGTLYVHRTMRSKNGLQVYAFELVLGKARDGLAKGTAIILGAARAGVKR